MFKIIFTGFRCAPPGAKFFEPAPQAQRLSSHKIFRLFRYFRLFRDLSWS